MQSTEEKDEKVKKLNFKSKRRLSHFPEKQ